MTCNEESNTSSLKVGIFLFFKTFFKNIAKNNTVEKIFKEIIKLRVATLLDLRPSPSRKTLLLPFSSSPPPQPPPGSPPPLHHKQDLSLSLSLRKKVVSSLSLEISRSLPTTAATTTTHNQLLEVYLNFFLYKFYMICEKS